MQKHLREYSAYQVENAPTRSDRSVEYQAFAKITSRLAKAGEHPVEMAKLAETLHQNRRLWNILAADVISDDNQLPVELRARIFSLAEFVRRQTSKILESREGIDVLIDLNRTIMVGLK